MDIVAFIPCSHSHWPGKKAAVVFTPGCNFRCGYCHDYPLILYPHKLPLIEMDKFTQTLSNDLANSSVEAVVVSGGEPTLQGRRLIAFLEELKDNNVLTRLETNGSNPGVLEYLIEEELIDFIGLALKSRLEPESYARVCGVKADLYPIRRSIHLIKNSGVDYEFRLTFVPGLHQPREVFELVQSLGNIKRFVLQQFDPASGTLDKRFEKIGLGSYDQLLEVAKQLDCQAQEIRLRTNKGEEIVMPVKNLGLKQPA